MAIVYRRDVNRPLTVEEIDGNFEHLESASLSPVPSQSNSGSFTGSFTGVFMTPQTLAEDITIPDGYNAILVGPTVASGSITITVEGSSTLRVI